MAEQPPVNLHELAEMVRDADHLGPETQQALAGLLDELGKALTPGGTAPAEVTHLAASTAQLAHALREPHKTGPLAAARKKFEAAVAQAEAKAPMLTGLAQRFIETLANLGI
jgi:hypothetical protein